MKTPSPDDAQVFLSFSSKDANAAEALKDAIKRAGYDVWWSPSIQCGGEWHGAIDEKLAATPCVVVLWTENSCASKWVCHEASFAMARGKYAPAKFGAAPISSPYDRLQAADVTGTALGESHPGLRLLLHRIATLLPPPLTRAQQTKRFLKAHALTTLLVAFGVATSALLLYLTLSAGDQVIAARAIPPAVSQLSSAVGGLDGKFSTTVQGLEGRIVKMFEPKLGFVWQFGISAVDPGLLAIENAGGGIATVQQVRIRFDGKDVEPSSSALLSLAQRSGFRFRAFSLGTGDTFAPGRSRTIYQIPAEAIPKEEICARDKARKVFFERLEIDVEYSSSAGSRFSAPFRYRNTNSVC
jgi:hypothetical protein